MKYIIDFPTSDGKGWILKMCKENGPLAGRYITNEALAAANAEPEKDKVVFNPPKPEPVAPVIAAPTQAEVVAKVEAVIKNKPGRKPKAK